jgi:hypothetical protein
MRRSALAGRLALSRVEEEQVVVAVREVEQVPERTGQRVE